MSVPVFPVLPGGVGLWVGLSIGLIAVAIVLLAVWLRKVRAIDFALDHAVGSGSGTGVRAG